MNVSCNPFETQIKSNLFSVNCKVLVLAADITPFTMVINSTFTPSNTSSECTSEESTQASKSAQGEQKVDEAKYKTEMCKNWIETNIKFLERAPRNYINFRG